MNRKTVFTNEEIDFIKTAESQFPNVNLWDKSRQELLNLFDSKRNRNFSLIKQINQDNLVSKGSINVDDSDIKKLSDKNLALAFAIAELCANLVQ